MSKIEHIICTVEGCDRKHLAKGLCSLHYGREWLSKNPLCPIEGCTNRISKNGLCPKHNWRMKRYGANVIMRRENGTGPVRYAPYNNNHIVIAEKALGKPLPKGAEVHHFDENKLNNDPRNLVVCPNRAYHALLHKRMRALKACGNPNWIKCQFCKQYDDPANMKIGKSGQGNHPECIKAYQKQWTAKHPGYDTTKQREYRARKGL